MSCLQASFQNTDQSKTLTRHFLMHEATVIRKKTDGVKSTRVSKWLHARTPWFGKARFERRLV